jgi:hypothetical protein
MKTPSNDGGQTLPKTDAVQWTGQIYLGLNGMTLRDYFAGQAVGELIKREVREIRKDGRMIDCFGLDDSPEVPRHTSHIASESYAIADAMLAARERKEDAP